MRPWMAMLVLAAVAGGGAARARSHDHHRHRGLHALSHPGPTEAEMRAHLAVLSASPPGALAPEAAAAHLEPLVACPQPLIRLLAGRPPSRSGPLVEVLTRRYYKIRALRDVHTVVVDDLEVVRARYAHRDRLVPLELAAYRRGAR